MAIRKIITIPNPLLKEVSNPVAEVNGTIIELMDDMLETMYAASGIGLAAIQVAVPLRVIVMDIGDKDLTPEPLFLVNPEIISKSDVMSSYEEGCLSVPGSSAVVSRPDVCSVKFLARNNKERTIDCEGLLATCIQHELDHLNGNLFIDYLSKLRRDRIVRKLSRANKQDLVH